MKKIFIFMVFLGSFGANLNILDAKTIDFNLYKMEANPFANEPVLLIFMAI